MPKTAGSPRLRRPAARLVTVLAAFAVLLFAFIPAAATGTL